MSGEQGFSRRASQRRMAKLPVADWTPLRSTWYVLAWPFNLMRREFGSR
jgi:hypothetical protein